MQIYLIWAFVKPEGVVGGTLDRLEEFAHFCANLWPEPPPLVQGMAAIAGVIAIGQIYTIGVKPKPPAGPTLDALKAKIGEEVDAAKKTLG